MIEVELKKQIIGFDYLRVIACFLVVFLHVSYTNEFLSKNVDLTYIAVPEFVLLSIFLLGYKRNISFNELIRGLFLRIGPQYFFWTTVYLVLYIVKCKFGNVAVVINFSKLFLGASAVQLWYLPALFLWQILAYFLFRFKNDWIDGMLFVVLFVLARILLNGDTIEHNFLRLFIDNTPYIILAKNIFLNQEKLKKIDLQYLLFLIALFLVSMYVFEFINLVYTISLSLASVFVFILFYKTKIESNSTIRFLSKLSFGVYLIHFGVYQVIVLLEKMVHINNSGIPITLVNIICTCVISVLISYLFSRNKYLIKVI